MIPYNLPPLSWGVAFVEMMANGMGFPVFVGEAHATTSRRAEWYVLPVSEKAVRLNCGFQTTYLCERSSESSVGLVQNRSVGFAHG